MTIPYTYLLKFLPDNTFYYGVRYAKGCKPEDFWVSYFTSSKHIHKLIETYGKDCFEFEIRKTFKDNISARKWENKVLRRMKVLINSKFLNRTDNISISPELCGHQKGKFGKDHNRFGKKNPFLSEYNKKFPKKGENHGCYGRIGELHPLFGKKGKLHPAYGNKRHDMSKIVICPNCNKSGKLGGMQRWHFDKCKNR